jgi:hypothetical protein
MISAGAHASSEVVRRFLTEAEVIARLRHPNVVQIYGMGDHEGRPYLELEYVAGGSLAARLDGTPWTSLKASAFLEVLARAVHEAHRQGVVHRDLKPSNVLLTEAGQPKIADFGLAKLASLDPGLTRTDTVLGTPSYMAPEQAEGRTRASGSAADVYSLGAIFYELLTGRPPFRAATVLMTLDQVRSAEPVPPSLLQPGLPRDAETICLKCLEKDPAGRYPTAEALAEDLRSFAEGWPISARGSNVIERLVGVLRRRGHGREFGAWGNLILFLTPFCTLPHLVVFLAARFQPRLLALAGLGPTAAFVVAFSCLIRLALRLRPWTPAVRQAGAALTGLLICTLLVTPVAWMLGRLESARDGLALYPIFALLTGQMFFGLGASYWGWCYIGGLGFFAAALVMALDLTWAPLSFATVVFLVFGAIGLHLRRLDREVREDPIGTPALIPGYIEESRPPLP